MGAIGTDEWGVARLHARITELEELHDKAIERETKVRREFNDLQEAFYQKNMEYVTVIGCISAWTKLLPCGLKIAILEGKKLAGEA